MIDSHVLQPPGQMFESSAPERNHSGCRAFGFAMTRTSSALLACLAAAATSGAVAAAQITSHDGHARVRGAASVQGGVATVTIDCPASTVPCRGRYALRTKRGVTLARGTFAEMPPGTSVRLRARLSRAGRRATRGRRSLRVLGFALNELPTGDVQTVQPVRLAVRAR
jgi:hypothetical protein